MTYRLFLDDERDPPNNGKHYIIARSYDSFCDTVLNNGMPYFMSLDHDLGEEKTGYNCIQWLINEYMSEKDELPQIYVHSQNPIGKANILGLIYSYNKHFRNNKGR